MIKQCSLKHKTRSLHNVKIASYGPAYLPDFVLQITYCNMYKGYCTACIACLQKLKPNPLACVWLKTENDEMMKPVRLNIYFSFKYLWPAFESAQLLYLGISEVLLKRALERCLRCCVHVCA